MSNIMLALTLCPLLLTTNALGQNTELYRHPGGVPVTPGPANFHSGSALDSSWADEFNAPGADGTVFAVAATGDSLFVGGSFSRIGNLSAPSIALFDGSAWHAMGNQITGEVDAIAMWNGMPIAGGKFTQTDGSSADYLARWNGTAWLPFPATLDGPVYSLCVYNGMLLAGGAFSHAGAAAVNQIASWDGTSWSPLAGGVLGDTPEVYAMLPSQGSLYVGGRFDTADGDTVRNIARWDGSAWHDLAGGMVGYASTSTPVRCLATAGAGIVAGGSFSYAGGVLTGPLATWTGQAWRAVSRVTGGDIYGVLAGPSGIYATGTFGAQGHTYAANIVLWNGAIWLALGAGLTSTDPVWRGPNGAAIVGYHGGIVVGGHFTQAGPIASAYLANWNGNSWAGLVPGNGTSSTVNSLLEYNGQLAAGGGFTGVGNTPAHSAAVWDGTQWTALGQGMNFGIYSLAVFRGDLIAAGAFTQADGKNVNFIARWDGVQWQGLGTGLNGLGWKCCVHNDALYVGGNFTMAGGVAANRIAKWDGATWSPLGAGMDDYVTTLSEWNGALVAGGIFHTSGGITTNGIAQWDGANWSAFGTGLGGGSLAAPAAYSLSSYNGALVVGGDFSSAGGTDAACIASWDGSSWHALGDGIGDTVPGVPARVYALLQDGPTLTAGGVFTTAGDSVASGLARWDGANWRSVGGGVQVWDPLINGVGALALWEGGLYVGGTFYQSGSLLSSNIARWAETDLTTIGSPTTGTLPELVRIDSIYPLPSYHAVRIDFSVVVSTAVDVAVWDVHGRRIAPISSGQVAQGRHTLLWAGRDERGRAVAPGVYFVRVRADHSQVTARVVLVE